MINEDCISRSGFMAKLMDAGVDHVQTDDLQEINQILQSMEPMGCTKCLTKGTKEPKGHWINIYKGNTKTVIALRCSLCGNSPKYAVRSDFCPNCGERVV